MGLNETLLKALTAAPTSSSAPGKLMLPVKAAASAQTKGERAPEQPDLLRGLRKRSDVIPVAPEPPELPKDRHRRKPEKKSTERIARSTVLR